MNKKLLLLLPESVRAGLLSPSIRSININMIAASNASHDRVSRVSTCCHILSVSGVIVIVSSVTRMSATKVKSD